MINLKQYRETLILFIHSSLDEFSKEHPNERISCVGIYCSPISGWVSINLDTLEHSSNHVKQYRANGPDWYGSDSKGDFNNNCPDFKYVEYRLLDINDWCEALTNDQYVKILKENNTTVTFDLMEVGDEEINAEFFHFLKGILDELSFYYLNKEVVFRIGVQMLDSEYIEFKAISEFEDGKSIV